MKTKKIYVSLAVLTLIFTAGIASALAYQGDYTKVGPGHTSDRHETIETALNNNDYNAWLKLMDGRGRVTQVINQSNFAKFAEAHKLAQAGDIAGADAIRAELGLRTSQGSNGGQKGQGHRQNNAKVKNFVDSNGDGVCDNIQNKSN